MVAKERFSKFNSSTSATHWHTGESLFEFLFLVLCILFLFAFLILMLHVCVNDRPASAASDHWYASRLLYMIQCWFFGHLKRFQRKFCLIFRFVMAQQPRQTQLHTTQIAQHVAITKSQERPEIGDAWFRSEFVDSIRIPVDMFMFIRQHSILFLVLVFLQQKKVCLFVCFGFVITNSIKTIFSFWWFLLRRNAFCLLPSSLLMFTHSGRFIRRSLHARKLNIGEHNVLSAKAQNRNQNGNKNSECRDEKIRSFTENLFKHLTWTD